MGYERTVGDKYMSEIYYTIEAETNNGCKQSYEIYTDNIMSALTDIHIDIFNTKELRISQKQKKTCYNIADANPIDEFMCSSCGFATNTINRIIVDADDGSVNEFEYSFNYCPNCGAEVVNK